MIFRIGPPHSPDFYKEKRYLECFYYKYNIIFLVPAGRLLPSCASSLQGTNRRPSLTLPRIKIDQKHIFNKKNSLWSTSNIQIFL